jgi:hypothetical protein
MPSQEVPETLRRALRSQAEDQRPQPPSPSP